MPQSSLQDWLPYFTEAEKQAGLQPGLLAAIAAQENVASHHNNPLGISNDSGPLTFEDPREAVGQIYRMAGLLTNPNGPYKDFARTGNIDDLTKIYSPVGASNDPNGTNSTEASGIRAALNRQGIATAPSEGLNLTSSVPINLSEPLTPVVPGLDLASPVPIPEIIAATPMSQLSADINDPTSGVFATDTYAPEETAQPETPSEPEQAPQETDIPHPSAEGAQITGKNADGSVQLSNGARFYRDGHIEFDTSAGTAIKFGPNSKAVIRAKPKAEKPIMVGGVAYDRDPASGELVPSKFKEGTEAEITDPYVGLNNIQTAKLNSLLRGDLPVTSRQLASNRDPEFKKILDRAILADPNFSPSNYDMRRKTRIDYSPGGKVGQNILSLNTAINHLGHLEEISKDIGSVPGLPFLNAPIQKLQKFFGVNPALRSWGITSEAVSEEMAKLLKGGVATAGEVERWREQLAPSQTPEYREQAFKDIIAVMAGRLDSAQGGWKDVFGESKPGIITSGAKEILNRHGWNLTDEADQPAVPTVTPTPSVGPKIAGVASEKAIAAYNQAVAVKQDPNATPEEIAKADTVIQRIESAGGIPQP